MEVSVDIRTENDQPVGIPIVWLQQQKVTADIYATDPKRENINEVKSKDLKRQINCII